MGSEEEYPASDLASLEKRLGEPGTVAALNRLLDKADLISGLLDVLTGFLGNSEHVLDNVRDSAKEITPMLMSSPTVKEAVDFVPTAVDFGEQLMPLITKVTNENFVSRFSESGLLDPAMINLTIKVASGINYANERALEEADIKPPGIVKLALMLKDLEVRRALAFALEVLKEVGRSLGEEPSGTTKEEGAAK